MTLGIPKGSLACFLDEHDSQDGMLVGGFYVPKKFLHEIDNHVEQVKRHFGLSESDAIKWNLADKACESAKNLIGTRQVDELRRLVFSIIDKIPVRIIMSFVWKGRPENTQEAWTWAFTNILQRLSIILDRKKTEIGTSSNRYPFLDVVFDWLPGNRKIDEYFSVYQDAYYGGYKFEGNRLLPLKTYRACPCLLVSSARYSQALQLADFFVGASGDFFKFCFSNEKRQSVEKHFSNFYKSFHRGDSNKVVGCGLIVKKTSKNNILKKLTELNLNS